MVTAAPRHYGIVVSDLERALGFYRDLLDLKVARQMDESGPFIETVLGIPGVDVTTCKMEAEKGGPQVELLCFKSHKDPNPRPPQPYFIGPTHMAFTVDNLMALHRRMTAKGVPFVSPPQVSADGKAKVAFCRDPDGTLLELVELAR
jgi:catechol 2,3-dioxygenase-like lactoylglutathione lyase family enzyme